MIKIKYSFTSIAERTWQATFWHILLGHWYCHLRERIIRVVHLLHGSFRNTIGDLLIHLRVFDVGRSNEFQIKEIKQQSPIRLGCIQRCRDRRDEMQRWACCTRQKVHMTGSPLPNVLKSYLFLTAHFSTMKSSEHELLVWWKLSSFLWIVTENISQYPLLCKYIESFIRLSYIKLALIKNSAINFALPLNCIWYKTLGDILIVIAYWILKETEIFCVE